jgi:hypothetical protein
MRRISLWPVDLWLFLCTAGALIFVGLRGYDFYYISRANDLLRVYAWGRVPLQLLPAYDATLVLALGLSSYVLWVIGLFGAMIKARDAAQRLGVAGHKWSGWAIASIIIPVVGWIVPWLVVGEIRRSIVSSARRSSFDDTWRTKSSFSAATLLVALCFLLNAGAAKVLSDINQNTTSAAGSPRQFPTCRWGSPSSPHASRRRSSTSYRRAPCWARSPGAMPKASDREKLQIVRASFDCALRARSG